LGIHATIELREWGFYPAGGGEIVTQIAGNVSTINPLHLTERGSMQRIWGTAVVSNLPSHIPQRMANRARNYLADTASKADVMAQRVRAKGPGAGIFLMMEHIDDIRAGFTAYGRKGLPAERVAEAACDDLLAYYRSNAPVDMHLADQLILPLAMAEGASQFVTSRVTEHLRTNMWVVEQFKQARFKLTDKTITIIPLNQNRGNGPGNDPEMIVSSGVQ
jgi:RNA 3'-terminal phosphate cyclase (ATP)